MSSGRAHHLRRKVVNVRTIAAWLSSSSVPLLALLSVVTGLRGAAALDCPGDDSADPSTVLLCKYLPPNSYAPIASPPSNISSSDIRTLCNGTDCESWQCYYCPYCSSVEALCVCHSHDQLPGQKPIYRVAIASPLTSQTDRRCTFAEACSEELSNATANCSAAPSVELESISPTSGPASGGTLLTIKGNFLTALTKIVVGNSSCDLYSFRRWQTNNTAYCLLAGAKQAVNTTVQYTAIGRHTRTTGLLYTFLPDPVVLDITPRDVITSQTRIVVQGANLTSVATAFLIATSTMANTTYAPCVVESPSSLSCGSPMYGVENETTYDVSVYLDGFRSINLVNGSGSSNESNSSWSVPITLFSDPELKPFPSVGMLYVLDPDYGGSENGANIVISGSGLTAVNSSRYLIRIGNGTTCVVASVEAESLTCTPSSSSPLPSNLGDNYTTYIGQHAPSILVTIEDSDYVMFIGYVMFYERRNAYIILGVAFGALVLVGIILVLALTVQVRRERAMKRKTGSDYKAKKVSAAATFDAYL